MRHPRLLSHLLYAGLCYLAGVGGILYCILFLLGVGGPTAVDDPPRLMGGPALLVDLGLVLGWGIQHSVMARPTFKRWWTRLIPPHTERATYCLASGVVLALVCWLWEPLPGTLWVVTAGPWRLVLTLAGSLGWVVLLAATFEIDHAELFGLKPAYRGVRGLPTPNQPFKQRFLYRVVRHPIQFGVLVGVWVTPDMTVSRLVFAVAMTAYILVGLHFEERALVREFGAEYEAYRRRVPMLIPFVGGSLMGSN